MNTFSKISIWAFVCIFIPLSAVGQNKTRKVIEDAMYNSQYKVVNYYNSSRPTDFSTHPEYVYTVSKCDIEEEDFNAFARSNPQYKFDDVVKKKRLKWGFVNNYIRSFKFRNTSTEVNTLEFAIRLSNHDPKLKMPSFHDVNEANAFYVKYVKPFEQLKMRYITEFVDAYKNYVWGNKERIKAFCSKSPYNGPLFKEQMQTSWGIPIVGRNARIIDVADVLNSALCDEDYVFYLESGYGYIYNNKNKYCGDIKKDKADGVGKFWDQTGTWEGSFKNGKKNGAMTHTWESKEYNSIVENKSKFTHEEKGNCVDGVWDGAVEYRVQDRGFNYKIADVEILHYDKGVLLRREKKDNSLTKAMKNHIAQYDNIEEMFASGKVRIPEIKRQENKDYDGNGHTVYLYFSDGVFTSMKSNNDGTYDVYDQYHFFPVKEQNFDRAARHAYLFEKFPHADVEVIIKKYGLPAWAK